MAETLNCETSELKTRWKTLRERYLKELKESQSKSGQSAAEPPSWEWFESMQFLQPFIKPRKSQSSTIETISPAEDNFVENAECG
ncbi:hypothetical protein ABEB36_014031 [Hypothenemus hampei]|uniref:MADF domain-containing protein n=1 Tax=Hypothenemus hampei TaxID=57062 RepID=A0ABD1E7N9_HYPHA